jgi:extracellular factor (EF) 3-hydroxypalmitic acid methyl ester biosynthesis protein
VLKGVESPVLARVERFTRYLSRINDVAPSAFDEGVLNRLEALDWSSRSDPYLRRQLMKLVFDECGLILDQSRLHQRARRKPLGYAGDYLLMDWIHANQVTSPGDGALWDEFFLRQPPAVASRNRDEMFGDVLSDMCLGAPERPHSVLDLGSGSCCDVADGLARLDASFDGLTIRCVDPSPRAISYAKGVVRAFDSVVGFTWDAASIYQFDPGARYDLIWVTGMLGFLPDIVAADLVRRIWEWTAEGGKAFLGNIHPRNPLRNYMEWCLEWVLFHRTEADLLKLCDQADIPRSCVSIRQEPLGIFSFCVLSRPKL